MKNVEQTAFVTEGIEEREDARLVEGEDQDQPQRQPGQLVSPAQIDGGEGGDEQEHDFGAFAAVENVQAAAGCLDAGGVRPGVRFGGDELNQRGGRLDGGLVNHQPFDPGVAHLAPCPLQYAEDAEEDRQGQP